MTLDELKSSLWGAAVLLRGKINATGYKEYIFPLVFFKRISDVHEEEYRKALELADGDEDFARQPENYSFAIPDKCLWRDIREVTENVGQALVTVWTRIEQANPNRLVGGRIVEGLGGIFGKRDHWTNKNILKDETISELIEHFSKIDLSLASCPADEMGNAYEYLVGQFADDAGNTAQEFYTNRTVVELMSEILEPKAGESIYDPTCGTGGMLISCIARCKTRGSTAPHPENWREIKAYGQEQNALTSSVARMNLFLHGVEEFRIINDDTLLRPGFLEAGNLKTFDVVLANPPYSIKQWNRDLFAHDPYGRNFLGLPPQGRADYAFIQHIFKSMDPKTGRCAILLPHGVLFREEEKHIRKALIENDLIEAVIGLAPNLFYNSPMEACVMVCRTNKPTEAKGRILFINAVGEVTRKNAESKLEPGHIEKILKAYHERTSDGVFAYDATIEEIAAKDWSLAISLYAHVRAGSCGGAESRSLKDALIHQMLSAEEAENQLGQLESAIIHGEFFERCIDPLIPEVNIPCKAEAERHKFDDIAFNSVAKKKPTAEDATHYIGLEHIDPGSFVVSRWGGDVAPIGEKLLMKKGDLLFGKRRAYQRKVAIAPFDGIFSAHGMVLRPKTDVVDEKYFPFFIASDQFMDMAVKISVGGLSPTINWKTLKECEFDLPPIERQRELANLLWAANDLKESYKKAISATDEMLKAKFRDAIDPLVMGGHVLPLDDFVDDTRPICYGILMPGEEVEGGVPVVKVRDYPNGEVLIDQLIHTSHEIDEEFRRSRLRPGDLLISIRGSVGRMTEIPVELNNANITQDTARLTIKASFDRDYVRTVLESTPIQQELRKNTRGVAIKGINIGFLRKLLLPCADIKMQHELGELARKARLAKSALKKSIADIDQVMKGLING